MLPENLAGDLLPWYDEHARDLPWRREITPYRVWISEIMLQQTRIEAAREYFRRFMDALPDVAALAAAEEDRVLKLWEGLGYYSRARNLHRAAKLVMERYGGALPGDATALRALPGIGDYTAGAIASIAFGLPEPAVDGNVLRVCSRLSLCPDSIGETRVKAAFREALRRQYPPGRCGDFTSALMELGETVCTPGTPDCGACPLTARCGAYREGRQADFPVMPEKRPRRIQPRTVFLLQYGGRIALRKRPDRGLLAGLWEFPGTDGTLRPEQALAQAAAWGCEPRELVPCGEAVHIFTHIEWHMTGYRVACGAAPDRFVWADPSEQREKFAVPSAFQAFKSIIL